MWCLNPTIERCASHNRAVRFGERFDTLKQRVYLRIHQIIAVGFGAVERYRTGRVVAA